MTVRRFYCPDLSSRRVELAPEDAQHARKVLRLAAGHTVELFDGRGTLATGRIEEMTRRCVLEVTEHCRVEPLIPRIEVAAAMPKGSRADVMVEKLSELGADRLIALVTERSVVEPRQAKMERFGRMVVESAKQCGRAWVMEIEGPRRFGDVVVEAEHDIKLIADVPSPPSPFQQEGRGERAMPPAPPSPSQGEGRGEGPRPRAPHSVTALDVQDLQPRSPMASMLNRAARVLVLVGPEGGWTDAERHTAQAAGFAAWCFAPHVLRVETAALAAVACLRSQPTDEGAVSCRFVE